MNGKKLISLICAGLLLVMLSGCADVKSGLKPFDTKTQTSITDETVIAENDKYTLCFNRDNQSVYLKDNITGTEWGTTPDAFKKEKLDEWGDPISRHPQADSLLFIEYMSSENGNIESSISYTSANQDGRITTINIENGMRITYYFDEASISVPVDYVLEDDGLALTIKTDMIAEGKNKLLSISVAPFMCSVENDLPDTYLLYPSGSGAIIYPKSASSQGTSYSSAVYGTDPSIETWDKPFTEKSIRLPVYGYRGSDNGGVAIIENGAENTYINSICGSISIGYSSVYTKYQLRGYTNNISNVIGGNKVKNQVYSDKVIDDKLCIKFYPLEKIQANYNTMASVYREHLFKKYGKKEKSNDKLLNVNLLGGIMIKKSFLGVPYTSLLETTTLSEAEQIATSLSEANSNMAINLVGFGVNGISTGKFAGGFDISSNLGGKAGLKEFSKFCTKRHIDSYLDVDFIYYSKGAGGFNSFFDRAEAASHKIAYSYLFDKATLSRIDNTRCYLLNRKNVINAVNKFNKKSNTWDLNGIGISSLSSVAYSDYTDKENASYYAKSNMGKDVISAIDLLHKSGKKVCSADANDYAAMNSDLINCVANTSSKSDIFDEDIPFYQIVFKGFVPMTSEPVNLSSNPIDTYLSAVETGCGLNYTCIKRYDNALLDSNYAVFYSSVFKDLKDTIFTQTKEYNEFFNDVNGCSIKNYSVLANGLHKTTFSNGTVVFVNRTNKALNSPLGDVKPYSFVFGGDTE